MKPDPLLGPDKLANQGSWSKPNNKNDIRIRNGRRGDHEVARSPLASLGQNQRAPSHGPLNSGFVKFPPAGWAPSSELKRLYRNYPKKDTLYLHLLSGYSR
jgi:hypothetical protein